MGNNDNARAWRILIAGTLALLLVAWFVLSISPVR